MSGTLAELVRDAARRTPSRDAIIDGAQRLTWAQLDASVGQCAAGLLGRGLRPGDRVGLILGNSRAFVVAYFGILRAGLVAVPLNPAYTAPEVAVVVADAGVRLLIADAASAQTARAACDSIRSCEVIEADTGEWAELLAAPPVALPSVDDDALALLLFTAGTSGRPKGAMLTHAALRANIDMIRTLQSPPAVVEDDVVLLVLPMFHVYGLNTALGLAVSAGATCVIVDRFDPVESLRLVREHRVTTIAGAPAMFAAWLRVPDLAESLASVRLLSSGGSPLPGQVLRAFTERCDRPIFEGYGMTETAPVIATTLVSGAPKPDSVGRPLPGLEIRIVDEGGAQADEGDPGELWVRGPSVFSGYWPDGAGGPDADGWFESGDIAYRDAEGDLHLVDRRREVILVNGFNVYPREVEIAIEAMPEVAEVAVMGVPDDATGEAVTATVVARPGAALSADDVLSHCATRLARFKMPTVVRIVAALPHSATGKVAKGRLREVYGDLA